MFTDPPLAHVGLSEVDAQRRGIPVRVAILPMHNVLRTEATDEIEGFMKVLVDGAEDRILGFTMIGSEAGEVMARQSRPRCSRAYPIRSCATPSGRISRSPRDWARCWRAFRQDPCRVLDEARFPGRGVVEFRSA